MSAPQAALPLPRHRAPRVAQVSRSAGQRTRPLVYRADIDGLRAVAILAVVAFHGGYEKLAPGGYVGVDVFFVISGFLITRLIDDGIDRGSYSIADFYDRRARRILPALAVVLFACMGAAWLTYFPVELSTVQTGVAAASLSVSNILFYNASGYFDQAMSSNPLLHTWSLSVEEQFYILLPIFIWAIRGFTRRSRWHIMAGVAAVSLTASAIMIRVDPSAAFYLVPYRAWELLVGAMLSLGVVPPLRHAWQSEALGVAGLSLIAASILVLDRTWAFPGLAALPPCLGAAALIHAGTTRSTAASRLMSVAPLRFFGLISYSLYLWHWPIIVFVNLVHEPHTTRERLLVIVASIAIATLSWFCVERPFRGRPLAMGVRTTLLASGAVIGAICVTAVLLGPLARRTWRVSPDAQAYLATLKYDPYREYGEGRCFLTPRFNDRALFHDRECLRLASNAKNVLVIGDSHAAHLMPGYRRQYPGLNFLQATASGCKPTLPLQGDRACTDLAAFILSDFVPRHRLDAIVISARWSLSDVERVLATVQSLAAFADRVIVSGPTVEYSAPLPRVLARAATDDQDLAAYSNGYRRTEQKAVDAAFAEAPWPPNTRYVSVYGALCGTMCKVMAHDGLPLQFDYGHFTAVGSQDVIALIGPQEFD